MLTEILRGKQSIQAQQTTFSGAANLQNGWRVGQAVIECLFKENLEQWNGHYFHILQICVCFQQLTQNLLQSDIVIKIIC